MNFLQSTLNNTCPKCRKGKLYTSPFDWKQPVKMNQHCEVCHQKFEPEPGFYYGAMFISYLFIGILSLAFCIIMIFGIGVSFNITFSILLVIIAIGFIWNLRLSRSIWIHLMIKYDPQVKDQTSSN